ncbi:MAG: hypothetical protein IBX62_04915 [Coriobacteriia bacterium]|nr:hypothetical protein [Coriobacteriia bacterium]
MSPALTRSVKRFLAASVVLNALIVVSLLTSTPEESPAATWKTAAWRIANTTQPVADREALEGLHAAASDVPRERCVACHGDKTSSKLPLHRIHLTSDLLPGLGCPDCHREISLKQRTSTFSVRMVDVGFCKDCHSEFPGLEENSPMVPEDFEVDCTTCHSGRSAFRHQRHYLSHIIAPRECKGCHGGRVLPWSPEHEREDWLAEHGPKALEVGRDNCFKCHEFGLSFCDQCHSDRPPSHTPKAQWLATHSEHARDDTRRCFACHESNFCRKCHVNHEEGWLDRHPVVVNDKGPERCWECHSDTFCSYCHARSE